MSKKETKKQFETFYEIGAYDLGRLQQDHPSCFNGMVRIKKYRVIVEEIDEPVEVLKERLLKLWRESDSHHHMAHLRTQANKLGLELNSQEFGSKKPKQNKT